MPTRPISQIFSVEVEVAIIQAATQLTIQSTGKTARGMAERYRRFYDVVLEAYNERHD